MYILIWSYLAKAESEDDFLKVYDENGRWAEFFRSGSGFLGTRLLKNKEWPHSYLTIDYWKNKDDYLKFRGSHLDEYLTIDRECEPLTDSEVQIGSYEAETIAPE